MAGDAHGKVKRLIDSSGKMVNSIAAGKPAKVVGFDSLPPPTALVLADSSRRILKLLDNEQRLQFIEKDMEHKLELQGFQPC